MKKNKTVFVTDFDGTMTKEDFFHMVCEKLLTKDALKPWEDYQAGLITHIAALDGIFSQIRITQAQMDKFIASIEVDKAFYKVLKLCKSLKIPVYICSAGSAYYINKRVGKYIKEYDIGLLANEGEYSPETGLRLTAPPKISPFYSKNLGVSKEALVKMLKKQGYYVIYAGDGRPDFKAAKRADAVFARSSLLELCKADKVPAFELNSFKDIEKYLKDNYGGN